MSTAKALALVWDVPFVAVNHLEAHLYAVLLEDPDLELPVVVLLVSGGHTMLVVMEGHGRYRLLGSTIDDAAGEAFDKVARYLGLGYPGGPAIDRVAMEGDPTAIAFPRAMLDDGLDFSFSGLKTSVINHVRQHPDVSHRRRGRRRSRRRWSTSSSPKARRAADEIGAKGMCLGGGVAANSLLRERFLDACEEDGRARASCRAGPCAPTTPPWWPPPAGGACSSTARARSTAAPTRTSDFRSPPTDQAPARRSVPIR